jgi:hypothetical protein
MKTQTFTILMTAGWVFTIGLFLLYVWNYELRIVIRRPNRVIINVPLPNLVIRNNQVHPLEDENTKENSTSSCYNNETKEETKIAEIV